MERYNVGHIANARGRHQVGGNMQTRCHSWWVTMVVVAAAAWSLGLGDGGGGSDAGILIPQRTYTVQVTDTKGQAMEATRFTWEGKVYFRGQLGNATVTLLFQKLKSLKVLTG